MRLPLPLTILSVLLLPAGSLFAQQDRGTIAGVVTDPSGAVLDDAKVGVVSRETGAQYTSLTNKSGRYAIPNLPVGLYKMTVERAGFKSLIRDNVKLDVAQIAQTNAEMQIGGISESIEVQETLSPVQVDTSGVGKSINDVELRELPLGFAGGRFAEDFAYRLVPGVSGNNWESRINGSPAFSKAVVLDGADATIYIGGQFGESTPSLEAFQEVRVLTSGMSSEFGRTGGGVFSFIMKSGANRIHGSAFGLIHNEWMDANSFVNNYYGKPRQRDRRHDWGGSFGGPVIIPGVYSGQNKTFFYAAFERYKESYAGGGSPTVTVPLDQFWGGDLSRLLTNEVIGQDALGRDVFKGAIYDPATTRMVGGQMVRDAFPGNVIPQNRLTDPARKLGTIFKAHYSPRLKTPDGLVPIVNNAFFPISNQGGFTQNQLSIKADHNISVSHKITGSFVYIDRPRLLLDQGGVWDFNEEDGGPLSRARHQWVRSWYGRTAYDWVISPSLVSHLQLGFNRQRNPSLSTHLGENGATTLGLSGLTKTFNYPEINFGGSYLVNYPSLGYQTNDFGAGQNYQLIETLSWVKGRHFIRVGGDWRRSYLRWRTDNGPAQIDFFQAQTGLSGFVQSGSSFASMLLGEVGSASVPTGTPTGSRFLNLALFLHDDWKVTRRLTLNLGLRWDYQPLPVEQYDRLSNWNPNLVDPAWGLPGALEFAGPGHRTFARPHYLDLSPRIGFAFHVDAKSAVRGAYGIFYHARNANGWSGVPWGQTAGYGQENRVVPSNEYSAAWNWANPYSGVVRNLPRNASLASGSPGVWGIVSYDSNAGKNGYTQQWNLNIQRELPFSLFLDMGYVGSKSTAIQANELRRLNQLDPKYLALGDVLGAGVTRQSEVPAAIAAAGGKYPFGNSGTWIPAYQTLLPYPQMMAWNEIKSAYTPLGFSTYHALQVQLDKQFSSGLSFRSNYSFSKTIDNVRSAFGDTWGANWGRPLNYYDLSLDKSISDSDRTHTIKVSAQYSLPVGTGRRYLSNRSQAFDFFLGGWTIQYLGNYNSGVPLGISGSWTPNGNLGPNRALMVNPDSEALTAGWNSDRIDMSRINQPNAAHQYLNKSVFIDPVSVDRYLRGNTSFRISNLRGPWELNDDFSLQKNFHPLETLRLQFRMELLNAFNRTHWGNIDTNAGSSLFGQVVGASDWYRPRRIQFGIRADW